MGRKKTPNKKAIRVLKRGAYKFDQDAQERFFRHYMRTGRIYESAMAANVSQETVRIYERENIEGFAETFQEVKGLFRDSIEAEITRRAMEGVAEPIIGGKNRDQVVTTVQRYSDRLLELLAKRHIPEYRDKNQLDVNVAGGVMVIPAQAPTGEDWSSKFGELERPKDEDAVTIDMTVPDAPDPDAIPVFSPAKEEGD